MLPMEPRRRLAVHQAGRWSGQKLPILHNKPACIDVHCLPGDARHALPAAPREDRVMSGRDRRNEIVIGMLTAPIDLASAGRSAGVRPIAIKIGTHHANHHVSVGTAEHSRLHCHVAGDGGPQCGAGRRRQIARYRPQRVIVADPCARSGRRLCPSLHNRPRRQHGQAQQRQSAQHTPPRRGDQLTAPRAGEHHLDQSGRHRAP